MKTDIQFKEEIQKKIDWSIQQIISVGEPERIYLFGSYAKGKEDEDSDFDFCVLERSLENRKKKITEYYKALFQLNHSKDIILRSVEEFEIAKNILNTLEYDIDQEGILLYERKSKIG